MVGQGKKLWENMVNKIHTHFREIQLSYNYQTTSSVNEIICPNVKAISVPNDSKVFFTMFISHMNECIIVWKIIVLFMQGTIILKNQLTGLLKYMNI